MWSGINNVTMASLSLQLAQWNWITRADAGYLQVDGKTLCSFTVVSYHIDLKQLWLIVIREVDRHKVEYLKTKVGSMFTFIYNINKGELTNWQFDWGGRL
jgi:hypothetical protein